MAKVIQARNEFSAGEVSPEALQKKDARAAQNGLKLGRNIRLRNGGGFSRRPGSRRQVTLAHTPIRGIAYSYDADNRYSLIFADGRMDAYTTDGVSAGNVTGAPWSLAQTRIMSIVPVDDRILIFHPQFATQQLRRTGAATWTLGDFDYEDGPGNTILQPYYRYADAGVTMQIDNTLPGPVNVTFSTGVLQNPGHLGVRFRYMGAEVVINTITTALAGTGTLINQAPPTWRVTVTDTIGFEVGDRVEGDTSGAAGYVTQVVSGTVMDVIIETGFGGFQASEYIVGPNARTAFSAQAAAPAPAATVIWDEAEGSQARGYAGEGMIHRKRLLLGDWGTAPDAWNASATSAIGDFDVGQALDNEAINEVLKQSPRERVKHFVSAETMLLFTDHSVFYVAEGRENVLTPTYCSLFRTTRIGVGDVEPWLIDQGTLFIEKTGTRALIVTPTGNITSPWVVADLSRLVPQFMRSPVEVGSSTGNDVAPEPYGYVVNGEDGSVAVLYYRVDDDPIYGWTLYTTEGEYLSTWAVEGEVFAIVRREIDGNDFYWLEKWDEDCLVDAGSDFTDPDGAASLSDFDGGTVSIVEGDINYGLFEVSPGGVITVNQNGEALPDDGGHTFTAGFSFEVTAELISPVLLQDIKAAGPFLRIPRCWVSVLESGVYRINGQLRAAYDQGDDEAEAPPRRTETRLWGLTGRSPSPTVTISQDADMPSPLTVLSVTMEVAGAAPQEG